MRFAGPISVAMLVIIQLGASAWAQGKKPATLAELAATGRTPDLIEPFKLERFYEDKLVSELAAAAVSH